MTAADPSPWLTVPEVATYARSSRSEVHEALRTGALRGHQTKPRGKYRINRADVDAWLTGVAPAPLGEARFSRKRTA